MSARSPAASPLVQGFRFAGVAAGIKPSGKPDLALIVADEPASVAGVFTTNRVKAAPVRLSKRRVRGGHARAVVVNAGNANAATGEQGARDARSMTAALASGLGVHEREVLVCSTGVIGQPMPMERVLPGIDTALDALDRRGLARAAEAVLTTDTRPKIASARFTLPGGRRATVAGFCKGAGMIHPNMATMLGFLMTDAPVAPATLDGLLRAGCKDSFQALTIDGDQSTNDTVLFLASGAAGGRVVGAGGVAGRALESALARVLEELAVGLVRDGEGVTRVARVLATGARTEAEARRVADAIARSLLVKTALHGGDPNWGRILSAAGSTRVPFDPEAVWIEIGGVRVYDRGTPATPALRARAGRALVAKGVVPIEIHLARGKASAPMLTGDLSAEYVRINSEYTT